MGHAASLVASLISFTIRASRMGSFEVLKRGMFSHPSDSPSARGGWGLEDVGNDKSLDHDSCGNRTLARDGSCGIEFSKVP